MKQYSKYLLLILLPLFWYSNLQAEYKGTFFGRANFDFSVPFVFLSKEDTTEMVTPSFDKYYFEQFSVPFHIALELAYLAGFTAEHKLLGLWRIKYSDDPINTLFNDDVRNKLNAPRFTSQSINNFILLKYIFDISKQMVLSPSFHINFDLNRDGRLQTFLDNFYNSQIYSLFVNYKLKNLGDEGGELHKMVFDFDLGYSYNYLPNSVEEETITGIPTSKEDFHGLDFTFKYYYFFLKNFYLQANYRLNFKSYVEKRVHSGNFSEGYTDKNQQDVINYIDLFLHAGLLDEGDYNIIDITTAYNFSYMLSSHVELQNIDRTQVGNYPVPDGALLVNNRVSFYQKDFKDYYANIVGLYFNLNINVNHGFRLGYSFAIKNFLNTYGRAGNEEVGGESGQVEGNGSTGSSPLNTYGVYLGEKRRDMFHTTSFGYTFKNSSRDRLFYPYIGVQIGESNDHTLKLNRIIFLLGMKVNYEF